VCSLGRARASGHGAAAAATRHSPHHTDCTHAQGARAAALAVAPLSSQLHGFTLKSRIVRCTRAGAPARGAVPSPAGAARAHPGVLVAKVGYFGVKSAKVYRKKVFVDPRREQSC
jgi:hypothetical protein